MSVSLVGIRVSGSPLKEKSSLETRLAEINAALGLVFGYQGRPRGRATGQGNNPVSLKSAVMKMTNGRALTRPQILAELEALGYKFNTAKPMNSLGVVLYGRKPKFNRENGSFILAPGQMPPPENPTVG